MISKPEQLIEDNVPETVHNNMNEGHKVAIKVFYDDYRHVFENELNVYGKAKGDDLI